MPGETICHYNGIRIRAIGEGDLNLSLKSLDELQEYEMVPLTLSTTSYKEPTRLANFMSQRAKLVGGTTAFEENFRITRIVIMIKPQVFTEYPA